jgi:hygromycin-B 4-O-kinase
VKKPRLPSTAACQAAASHMPALCDFQSIAEGEESQAYSFRSAGEGYVLRINHQIAGFEKDTFAHRRFARRELPIPEILHVGQLDPYHFYCISRMLPGRTLQSLVPQELQGLLRATADVMQRIAESDVTAIRGFGPFHANGIAGFASWREYLLSVSRYPYPAACDAVRYLLELERSVHACPEVHCLVHGDFGSNNVLAAEGRISGVLDWSEALIGDPLYDVANIFFWREWLECMELQARFFETNAIADENRDRLLCYQLHIGLRELAQASAISGWICERMKRLLF